MPINLNNSEEAIQGRDIRDIFQGEIFDNLKPNNFEGSNTTNVTIKGKTIYDFVSKVILVVEF